MIPISAESDTMQLIPKKKNCFVFIVGTYRLKKNSDQYPRSITENPMQSGSVREFGSNNQLNLPFVLK